MNEIRGTLPTILLALIACLCAGCAAAPCHDVEWKPIVAFQGKKPIERIRVGRPDPSDPNLQAVSVDQNGDVALMHFKDGQPSSEIVYANGAELTGLVIGDVDRSVPSEQIYAGGWLRNAEGKETTGAIYQIVVQPGAKARVHQIFACPVYVHSIERVPLQSPTDIPKLLVSTYDGKIHLLTPTSGNGPWDDRVLFTVPPTSDPEAVKAKDAVFVKDPTGRAPHEALVAYKAGHLYSIDLDHPEAARLILEEPGGLSRLTPDAGTGAYLTGYFGRLMHFRREGTEWKYDVLDSEGVDSGLRGAVLGNFPVTSDTTAHMAVWGFHKKCRLLVPRLGVLDPVTIFVDVDKGHTLEVADLVPGNGADELLVGGFSNAVKMLVAQ
jgi:hypothetical protein